MTIAYIKPVLNPSRTLERSQIWDLQYIDKENKIFTLRAVRPSSTIFAPTFSPNTGVVGSPFQSTGLQARETDTPGIYQILYAESGADIAFQSGPNEGDQVLLEELKASLLNQKWKFLTQ
ncbi:hypothetical protein Clacol_004409 [Clathrus columnatus]|uniref:Uncharacterized protein n=1 Tax=Clathrus columnatus TaxID=1419009 RepID=A0AAV5AC17_9AGAM|nr:hypothetical protein Clacol_004409 [Clathrus columnatus]